jgi:hypothetical protein
MKLPQFSLLADNATQEGEAVVWIVCAGVSCAIAAGVRIALTRYGVNKWVRSLVTIVVFFGLFACLTLAVWRFRT